MEPIEPVRPFRWDLARGDRLGSLVDGHDTAPFQLEGLTDCAARVLARSADGDMYFVGRSPDSLFDLLSGVLADSPHQERLHRLPLSLFGEDGRGLTPDERERLRALLTAAGVTPRRLAGGVRPVVFVDLVHRGSTFANLHAELRDWIDDERAPWNTIRGRLGYLGITVREKTSPNTWRWQQHADWVRELPARAVRNVSIEGHLWRYMGDRQDKTEPSFRRTRWADPDMTLPRHDDAARAALAEAVRFYRGGRTRAVRSRVHRVLTGEPAFRDPWLRDLARTLR
ncbi:hypothetical protein DFP74_5563 [Nocardiopsis sp. Huas11]|uniref:hypothetical protein n=1 Tax=Nocardiopsis sp. Huas11 TaxID=2183912 RepID=UPI000EAE4AA8|nr:hypothetical protein [Nocardiopsis sp. Huas11]RKS09818.1 hypothetical protein DFP74_5563 [Nocardiopsis sp. Huas11]